MPLTSFVFQVRQTCGAKELVVKQVAIKPRVSKLFIFVSKLVGNYAVKVYMQLKYLYIKRQSCSFG